MREYLLGKRAEIETIENHIFFFEDIATLSKELRDKQPHVSIHRSVCGYSAANEQPKTYFSFTNMMGIFIFTLYNKGKDEMWENTQIYNSRGNIEAKNQHIQSVCGQEIEQIITELEKNKEQLTEKQQEKITGRVKEAGKAIRDYPIFNSKEMTSSYLLWGQVP